jgi:hypothetical protein
MFDGTADGLNVYGHLPKKLTVEIYDDGTNLAFSG